MTPSAGQNKLRGKLALALATVALRTKSGEEKATSKSRALAIKTKKPKPPKAQIAFGVWTKVRTVPPERLTHLIFISSAKNTFCAWAVPRSRRLRLSPNDGSLRSPNHRDLFQYYYINIKKCACQHPREIIFALNLKNHRREFTRTLANKRKIKKS